METVLLKPLHHRGQESIGIHYRTSKPIDFIVKRLQRVKWSQTNKCWYVPLNKELYRQITTALKSMAEIDNRELKQYLQKKTKGEHYPGSTGCERCFGKPHP